MRTSQRTKSIEAVAVLIRRTAHFKPPVFRPYKNLRYVHHYTLQAGNQHGNNEPLEFSWQPRPLNAAYRRHLLGATCTKCFLYSKEYRTKAHLDGRQTYKRTSTVQAGLTCTGYPRLFSASHAAQNINCFRLLYTPSKTFRNAKEP